MYVVDSASCCDGTSVTANVAGSYDIAAGTGLPPAVSVTVDVVTVVELTARENVAVTSANGLTPVAPGAGSLPGTVAAAAPGSSP